MGEPETRRDPRGDTDRPVGAGRHEPVDVSRPREALDPLLVLGGEYRPLVGERKPERLRVAVDGDHVQVAAGPGGLEQAELGGARA
jgi:hypothetical protein